MRRFGEHYTRDVAGAFSDAQNQGSGLRSFEEAMGFASLGVGDQSVQLQAMNARGYRSLPSQVLQKFGQRRQRRVMATRFNKEGTPGQFRGMGVVLGGFEAVQASTSLIDVAQLQALLLKNGAQSDGLVKRGTNIPDGIWGAKTATQAKLVGQKLGFPSVGTTPTADRRAVTVTPESFITKLKIESSPQPSQATGDSTTQPTKFVQMDLLWVGAKMRGLAKNGKADGKWGPRSEEALRNYAKRKNLALSRVIKRRV